MDELERWESWCDANGLRHEDNVGFVIGLQSNQPVWSCLPCGTLVLDRYAHARWHIGPAPVTQSITSAQTEQSGEQARPG